MVARCARLYDSSTVREVMTVRDIGQVQDTATRLLNRRGVSIVSKYDYMVPMHCRVCIKIEICYRSDMLYSNRFRWGIPHKHYPEPQ